MGFQSSRQLRDIYLGVNVERVKDVKKAHRENKNLNANNVESTIVCRVFERAAGPCKQVIEQRDKREKACTYRSLT